MSHARALHVTAVASLTLLIALCVGWELWLAPLRPGGSWMVLKAVPLLAPLFGVLHARRRAVLAAAILVLVYFMEGATRAYADTGLSARLALLEAGLAALYISAASGYLRSTRRIKPAD